MSQVAPPAGKPVEQEFSVRLPRSRHKNLSAMRFNGNLNVDFTKWANVKLQREDNSAEYKGADDDMPKFGAGSEFGAEARRRKYAGSSKKYNIENQPWILKCGKTNKKFKGTRDGGINENCSYYVFVTPGDGIIEAYPLKEWYNFTPIQRYKALNADEAEKEFSRRNDVYNYFNLMARKKARNENEEEEVELEEKSKNKAKKEKDFKISEIDDWMESDEDDSDSDGEVVKKKASDDEAAKKKKKGTVVKKKKKHDSDAEAFEESDDGDEEGREREYISDSSEESDIEQKNEIKSVAEEDALRKQLVSDDEEAEEQEDKGEEEEEEAEDADKEKAEKKTKNQKPKQKNDSSDSGSDSDEPAKDNAGPSAGATIKRKMDAASAEQVKRIKTDYSTPGPSLSMPGSGDPVLTESAVRRYLQRKPITSAELLLKFRKKTRLTPDQLVKNITEILMRIKPTVKTIGDKKYFSLP